MHFCCHNAAILPECTWEIVNELNMLYLWDNLGTVSKENSIVYSLPFYFSSIRKTSNWAVYLDLRHIKVIYIIPTRIYKIICEINMIQCEHYCRRELTRTTFSQIHFNIAVS